MSKNCESKHFSARPFQELPLRVRIEDIIIYAYGDFGDHRLASAEDVRDFVDRCRYLLVMPKDWRVQQIHRQSVSGAAAPGEY